jgi:hypothetical protein
MIEEQAAADSPLQPGEQGRQFVGEDERGRGGHASIMIGPGVNVNCVRGEK